jgi:sterol 3beta-glucosyltransferase
MQTTSALPWPPEYRRNLKRKGTYRFVILNWGTRGDIQPFIALGAELVGRGHQVVLAAREPFRALAESRGLEFFSMAEDGTEDLMRALAGAKSIPDMLNTSTSYSRRIARQQLREFWEASAGADVILAKAITTAPVMHIAEARGMPVFLVHFDPGFIPTASYCFWGGRIQDLDPFRNRLMAGFLLLSFGLSLTDKINAWRREKRMRLDPLVTRNWAFHLSRFPAFAAWSRHFLPRPLDWPARVVQTGWWILPHNRPVDSRLRDFVREWPPPVYIGFGSWGVHDKTALTEMILDALRMTGNRAVLLRNTVDGRREFPPGVLVADDLPHDWLLPQMKAAVHHGGAGTAGAVITAGIPSVVVPSFGMQAAWGQLIAEKGIGRILEHRELTAKRLAEALRSVEQEAIRRRADSIGALARREGGVRQAAEEIEERLWKAARKPSVHTVPKLAEVHPTYTSPEYVAGLPTPDPLETRAVAPDEWAAGDEEEGG